MTSVSKNVYTGKLDDIYNKYNNTYHCTIGMKSVYVKSNTYIDLKITVKKLMITIVNSTLVILLEYQNIKMFLQKVTIQIGLKKILGLKKLKILCRHCTKMKFSVKDFFSKCDQICRKLRILSHLLKKSLMENFIFCVLHGHMLLMILMEKKLLEQFTKTNCKKQIKKSSELQK